MRPNMALRMGTLLLSCAGASTARGEELPLEPPATLPPPIEAPAPALVEDGPVLAVPGIPSSFAPRPRALAPASPPAGVGEGLPALIGPSEMTGSPLGLDAAPGRASSTAPGRASLPLELESVPEPKAPEPSKPRPAPRRPPVAPPRRAPRFFGRFLPAAPAAAARDEAGLDEAPAPKSDPAADAALKRRVERQARDALGEQLRSVEVRVAGRTVAIRARASRFWHRRGVRRALESLPIPAGYRSTVEVVD